MTTNHTPASSHRDAASAWSRRKSAHDKDIGAIPDVADPARREACRLDFTRFCLTYFPNAFPRPFSPDHRTVIAKIESAVLEGDLYAFAMPRRSGKTTLAETAAIWSVVYPHRPYVLLVGASVGRAKDLLESIKKELEGNDLLGAPGLGDFPEAVYPLRRLEGEPRRCRGQTYTGKDGEQHRTLTAWGMDTVVLPTVEDSAASGAVLKVIGIEGGFRGAKHKRADGSSIRPSLVILDDPQTDASALSVGECEKRERLIAGAVLGLSGPGQKLAALLPCTVIIQGDLADRMLDVAKYPDWNGSRFKLLYAFPTAMPKWDKYRALQIDFDPNRPGDKARAQAVATTFYASHRAEMDEGARVAWEEEFDPDEVSAVQHALNLFYRDERAFWSEYQNEPKPLRTPSAADLDAEEVIARLNQLPRGTVPPWAQRLTVGVDVQQDLLWYAVAAWGDAFTGAVIDYGAWPDQRRDYYTLSDARPTISQATGVGSLEGSLWAALDRLSGLLLGKDWPTAEGAGLRVERCLVDCGWGMSTNLVKRFCRESAHAAVLFPSKGMGLGAKSNPMSEWTKKPGERRGPSGDWIVTPVKAGDGRMLLFDANARKTFLSARLKQPLGEPGALTLFGSDPRAHRMLADHLASEHPVRTFGRGRELDEYTLTPGRDNHLWDCLVLASVAAAERGAAPPGMPAAPVKERKRATFAALQQKVNGG